MQRVGRVGQLWRYPVKSMAGQQAQALALTAGGVTGDRRWVVCDGRTGDVLTCRRDPVLLECGVEPGAYGPVVRLPGGRPVPPEELELALSEVLGRPVRVGTREADQLGFVDDTPVQLLSSGALAHMATVHPDGRWDVRRFRPNVLLDLHPGTTERDWVGSRVRVGDAELQVVERTARCMVTSQVQPGLSYDREILRSLTRELGLEFGVSTEVVRPGTVRVGDPVLLPDAA